MSLLINRRKTMTKSKAWHYKELDKLCDLASDAADQGHSQYLEDVCNQIEKHVKAIKALEEQE
jgi:hypothetical protein